MKNSAICKDMHQFVFPTDPFDYQRVPNYTTFQLKMFNGKLQEYGKQSKNNPSANPPTARTRRVTNENRSMKTKL